MIYRVYAVPNGLDQWLQHLVLYNLYFLPDLGRIFEIEHQFLPILLVPFLPLLSFLPLPSVVLLPVDRPPPAHPPQLAQRPQIHHLPLEITPILIIQPNNLPKPLIIVPLANPAYLQHSLVQIRHNPQHLMAVLGVHANAVGLDGQELVAVGAGRQTGRLAIVEQEQFRVGEY